jgi:hypothetical protein
MQIGSGAVQRPTWRDVTHPIPAPQAPLFLRSAVTRANWQQREPRPRGSRRKASPQSSSPLVVKIVIPCVTPGANRKGRNGPNGPPGMVSVIPSSSPASKPAAPMLHATLSVAGITAVNDHLNPSFFGPDR